MGIKGFKEKSYIFSKKKYKNSLCQTIHWAFFFFFLQIDFTEMHQSAWLTIEAERKSVKLLS